MYSKILMVKIDLKVIYRNENIDGKNTGTAKERNG